MWNLPGPGIEPCFLPWQAILSHWTTREVPQTSYCDHLFLKPSLSETHSGLYDGSHDFRFGFSPSPANTHLSFVFPPRQIVLICLSSFIPFLSLETPQTPRAGARVTSP